MLCNLAYVKNESRSTALSRLIDAVNRETCKVHNLLQPFEVSNYHLFVISSAKNRNIFQFCCLHSISRDGMSKDGQKMSPVHVTLKAGIMRSQDQDRN